MYLATREQIVDLRHKSEDAQRLLYEQLIDDRNYLESRVSILEREKRELKSQVARLGKQ